MNQRDKQISWQGIFKGIMQQEKDALKAEDLAYAINKRLYEAYPETEPQVSQKTMNQNIKICPVPDCGQPMIRQYNKKNPKGPDWKCSDKNCKFQKAYDGGWRASEYITGAWDPKPEDRAHVIKSIRQDQDLEVIQEEQFDDNSIPPEFR